MKQFTEQINSASKRKQSKRSEMAARIYRDYYQQCFWHLSPDLEITEEHLTLIIDGLRKHGGRQGFLLADQLCR